MSDPSKQSPEVMAMSVDWPLIDALRGGTRTMRAQREAYLPKYGMEPDEKYDKRLSKATLFPAFTDTVGKMVGRVFCEPSEVGDDVPPFLKDEETGVLDNIDLQGRNLDVFFGEVFDTALAYGISYVLVDAPPSPNEDGKPVTRAQEKQMKLRPYAMHVKPARVIGWRQENGELKQLRLRFERSEHDGEFGVRTVKQVRVYDLIGAGDAATVQVRLFEMLDEKIGEWSEVLPARSIDVPRIPFTAVYTGRTGYLTGEPPLRELAFLNAKHWAMQSSVDDCLETACIPILVAYGIQDAKNIVVGSKIALTMPASGKVAYTEHTGKAVEAGRVALDSLKDEMRSIGAKLLTPDTGTAKTATQVTNDSDNENSALGRMVRDLEDTIDDVLDLLASFSGEESGGSVSLNPNLDPEINPVEATRVLIEMNAAGALSQETLFTETQGRGFISDAITWEDEKERLDKEFADKPALPLIDPTGLPIEPPAPGTDPPAPTPKPAKPPIPPKGAGK